MGHTQIIDNFPGFEMEINGAAFAERLAAQAQRFGAEAIQEGQVTDVYRDGQYLAVESVINREFIGRAVFITTGSHFKKLNVPGENGLTVIRFHYYASLLQEKVAARENKRVLTNRAVKELKADGTSFVSVLIKSRETSEIEE